MSEGDEDEEKKQNQVNLEWRDYVAVVIAMFETVLIPVLVVLVLLVIIALLFVFFA